MNDKIGMSVGSAISAKVYVTGYMPAVAGVLYIAAAVCTLFIKPVPLLDAATNTPPTTTDNNDTSLTTPLMTASTSSSTT
jgi:hypothetical protein